MTKSTARNWKLLVASLLCLAILVAGCGGSDEEDGENPAGTLGGVNTSSPTSPSSSDEPATGEGEAETEDGPLGEVEVRLTRVATLSQPVAMAVRTGDPALYVAEKGGRVRAVRDGSIDSQPVLDLTGRVSTGGEQGLLGLAFSPDGSLLYVNYTDVAGDTHVVEYRFDDGDADAVSARELLFVDQPFANHNGGNLVFGPDGKLWIGLGDGGSGNDPMDNAQSLGTLLGKMLRIDPTPSAGLPYTIPADNPFVGRDGARAEIWAFGLRNPWRYSFDRATGDLWIGDVGQNAREEVNFAPASSKGGENYGWPALEGNRKNKGTAPSGAVAPIIEYGQASGECSVTGGYVYRGSKIPELVEAYLYGDYCEGEVRALRRRPNGTVDRADLDLDVSGLSSFGEDAGGELYALSLEGPLYRIDPA